MKKPQGANAILSIEYHIRVSKRELVFGDRDREREHECFQLLIHHVVGVDLPQCNRPPAKVIVTNDHSERKEISRSLMTYTFCRSSHQHFQTHMYIHLSKGNT